MALRENALRTERFTEKERRNLAIIDIIRRTKEVSRAEISRITHLNIVTISNYVDDYISKGLVVEKGLDVSTGGRRPELLELNPRYGYTIGIDLGPPQITENAQIVCVMLDVYGKIISKVKIKKIEEAQDQFIAKVVNLVEEVLNKSKAPRDKVRGIGIAIWGVLDRYKGTVRYATEGGGIFSYTALQSELERKFNMPTVVEHDAEAGALGEKWIGLGLSSESENILYVCSDSSCGIILNGELYYGASKSAGELNINPPVEGIPEENCWAKYTYGCCMRSRGIDLGIAQAAKTYLKNNKGSASKMLELAENDPDKVTFNIVVEAAKSQDKYARAVLTDAGEYLGAKIAFLINLFNPDTVIIGRGIENAGELFMETVRGSIKKWAYEESLKVARIGPTSLGEDSIACGAAVFVMQQMYAKI